MTEENNSSSLLQFLCLARGVATLKTMRCDAHNPLRYELAVQPSLCGITSARFQPGQIACH